MANKFPYLKSAKEPLGTVEQIAAAVTMHPDEDPAGDGVSSWFGQMLVPDRTTTEGMLTTDSFFWKYSDASDEEVRGRKEFADRYYANKLRYTTYDHKTYSLRLMGMNKAKVEGIAQIKGRYKRSDGNEVTHSGWHHFSYILRREEERWLVQEWILRKARGRDEALGWVSQ